MAKETAFVTRCGGASCDVLLQGNGERLAQVPKENEASALKGGGWSEG